MRDLGRFDVEVDVGGREDMEEIGALSCKLRWVCGTDEVEGVRRSYR